MRIRHGAALLLVLVASAVGAAPADGPIRVPVGPVVPTPMPAPPGPDAAIRLAGDQLFVIDSDNPILVLASPKGVVRVTEEVGPIRMRGRFVDGVGTETRTFKGKAVFVVEALVSGRCEILVVPAGAKESQVIRRTLQVEAGEGPIPPPKPLPPEPKPPEPKPEPKPVEPDAPIPSPGLRVLIVYESADLAKLPAAQQAVIYGAKFREYLQANCVAGPDGKTREWRMWDADVDTSAESRLWAAAMKRPRKELPHILISNGKTGFEGPLPKDVDAALELVGRYAK